MVERPEIQSSKQCCIYKVPHYLRKKWNEEVFSPQVFSIGLFHYKNERLKAMEEHKERHFRSFVKQSKINLRVFSRHNKGNGRKYLQVLCRDYRADQ